MPGNDTSLSSRPGGSGHGLLAGKVGVVTGAARGIGRATVKMAAEEGATVVAVDLRQEADALAGELPEGSLLLSAGGDLGVEEERGRIVEEILALNCPLNFICNNAGITPHIEFAAETYDDWRRCLAVNLDGPAQLTKGLLPALSRSGGGSVVNISSIHASLTSRGLAAYAASKAGLLGLTFALANELGPLHIRVNAITPGYIDTGFAAGYSPDERTGIDGQHPLRRMGRPEEVASVVVFLMSDLASFVTGTVVAVDGGLSSHLPGPTHEPRRRDESEQQMTQRDT
jgi:NAD(P)-dependent dehydrogenase (short-subunit alcohol dehydrogenase family)